MEFVIAAAMALVIKKVIDTIRMISVGNYRGVLIQLGAWLGGFLAVFLASQTPWADGLVIGDQNFADLNIWSMIIVGLSVGSAASTAHDVVVALDRHGVSVDANPRTDRRTANQREIDEYLHPRNLNKQPPG